TALINSFAYDNIDYGGKSEFGGARTYYYEFPTEIYLKMVMSVRENNPVTIDFGGHGVGNVSIISNSAVSITGQINNPDGGTAISAGGGSLTTVGQSRAIVTHDLSLSADAGIGTKTSPVQAVLTGTGTTAGQLSASGGLDGVFLKLDSGAAILQI